MCVSAMIDEQLKRLEREYEAMIGWVDWIDIFQRRTIYDLKIPKGIELQFEEPESADEVKIKAFIDAYRSKKSAELEQELFKQKKRLGDAERTLKTKATKKALEDQRIATNKIDDLLHRIGDVKRTERLERDSRIFPYYYVPIIVNDAGRKKIIPARYLCRPAGKPAFYDTKYPGCFNARRDSLEGFWRGQFGKDHAVAVITSFYENVPLHKFEHRELREGEKEQNVVLHFNPRMPHAMPVASLWSRWESASEPSLNSFAMITDEPPPEVAAAGHDRVVITLKRENVDPWLTENSGDKSLFYRLFDERERPYFEHRKAA